VDPSATNERGLHTKCHQEGLNTWEKLSYMEKLIEARKSTGRLKQKKGWRMKHSTVKRECVVYWYSI